MSHSRGSNYNSWIPILLVCVCLVSAPVQHATGSNELLLHLQMRNPFFGQGSGIIFVLIPAFLPKVCSLICEWMQYAFHFCRKYYPRRVFFLALSSSHRSSYIQAETSEMTFTQQLLFVDYKICTRYIYVLPCVEYILYTITRM